MGYLIIDSRMRKEEKGFLKSLGYELVEIPKSDWVYSEISSHVDIFVCKIEDCLIVEKSCYDYVRSKIQSSKIICGASFVCSTYPNDIKYNCCQIAKILCIILNIQIEKYWGLLIS